MDKIDNSGFSLDGIGHENDDIRYLFSYNIQRLAGVSSRIAALELDEQFGLTVLEWRALAVLDFLKAVPMHVLAQRAGVQKSQMSRLIADLEERRLVQRKQHPHDKRSVLLGLTEKAQALVEDVLVLARARNSKMLSYLSVDERRQLMYLLGKATSGSTEYLSQLKNEDSSMISPEPAPASLLE